MSKTKPTREQNFKKLQLLVEQLHKHCEVAGIEYYLCHEAPNHQVLVGYNDLQTTNPNLASEAFGWDPSSVTEGSNRKRKWKCKEGHTWIAVISSRRISSCPSCTKYGFDPNLDGYFYFLKHQSWEPFWRLDVLDKQTVQRQI
jgi:hypothetical protein